MCFCILIIAIVAANLYGYPTEETAARSIPPKAITKSKPVQQSLVKGRSLAFIENRGQFDPDVKFRAQSGNKVLWFNSTGVVFDVAGPSDVADSGPRAKFLPASARRRSEGERLVFSEKFANGRDHPEIEASAARPGIYNYFIGNDPKKWRTGVVSYSQILYREVWPGVDVRFVAKGSDIEQEFLVHPGADVASIHVQYSGIDSLDTPNDGSLLVQTKFGPLRESPPRIYQEVDGQQTSVPGRYLMSGNLGYAFKLGGYSSNRDLVIDPTLLFSTYIGAGGNDIGRGIAVDASGNTYIAGATQGPSTTPYPTTPGAFQSTPPNATSAVVSKFDPVGNLAYSTYLGSPSGSDNARGIAVDASGEAYITGVGYQGFPTTTNALQQSCGSSSFVSKLDAAGSELLYSTCVGDEGYGAEYGAGVNAIATDASGRAYITGSTGSAFPVTIGAFQASLPDQLSAFVSVIDPSLSGSASLVYSTFLGGEVQDTGTAIAVDAYSFVYVTGNTLSSHFPVTAHAFQTVDKQSICTPLGEYSTYYQCPTGFVAKLNPQVAGSSGLIYSSYLGGTFGAGSQYYVGEYPSAIAVDSAGSAYVGGSTASPNFPTTAGAFEPSWSCYYGNVNSFTGFVTKVDPSGSSLVYSTYLTPDTSCSNTNVAGISLNSLGNAYVVGATGTGFPVTADAFQSVPQGNGDAFLTELSASGASLVYSSYLGGSGGDGASAIAVDAANDAYLVGNTSSYDFPVTPFAFQSNLATDPSCLRPGVSCQDIFVAKFPLGGAGGVSITGIEPNFGGNSGTITPQIVGSGFHAGAKAQLNCGGQTVIGSNVIFGTLGRILNATFDLSSLSAGKCDMVVTNADGTSARLAQSFTVQQGGQANIQISVIGIAVRQAVPEIPDATTNAIFEVVAENRGNVDSPGGILSLPFPSPFVETSTYPQDIAGQGSAGVIWTVGPLPGQSTTPLFATATTPSVASTQNSAASAHSSLRALNAGMTNSSFTCDASNTTVTACFSQYTSTFDQNAFAGCLSNENSYLQAGIGVGCAGTIVTTIGGCLVLAPRLTPVAAIDCALGAIGSSAAICAFERTNPLPSSHIALGLLATRQPFALTV